MVNKTQFKYEPGQQNVIITRMFDEPPEVVFKTMTDPAMIPDWWGPREMMTTVDRFELKEGGVWRFLQKDNEGKPFNFHGVYHEVINPSRLVYTFEYEGMPEHPSLIVDTLENVEGMTKFTEVVTFVSVEDRDGMIAANMQMGIQESMDRVDELLKECCAESAM